MDDKGYSSPKVSEMKVLSTRFKSKDDRNTSKKMSKKEQAKIEQEKRRSELEEVKFYEYWLLTVVAVVGDTMTYKI